MTPGIRLNQSTIFIVVNANCAELLTPSGLSTPLNSGGGYASGSNTQQQRRVSMVESNGHRSPSLSESNSGYTTAKGARALHIGSTTRCETVDVEDREVDCAIRRDVTISGGLGYDPTKPGSIGSSRIPAL